MLGGRENMVRSTLPVVCVLIEAGMGGQLTQVVDEMLGRVSR